MHSKNPLPYIEEKKADDKIVGEKSPPARQQVKRSSTDDIVSKSLAARGSRPTNVQGQAPLPIATLVTI